MRTAVVASGLLSVLFGGCVAPSPGCLYPLERLDSFGRAAWNETGAYAALVVSPDNHWLGNFATRGLAFSIEPYFSQWGGAYLRLTQVEWNISDDRRTGTLSLSPAGELRGAIEPAPPAAELRSLFVAFSTNVTIGNESQLASWSEEFSKPVASYGTRPADAPSLHRVPIGQNESVERYFQSLLEDAGPAVQKNMGFRTARFGDIAFHFQIPVAGLVNPLGQWGHLELDPELAAFSYGRSWGRSVDETEFRESLEDVWTAYGLGPLELRDEPIRFTGGCVKAWR